MFFKLIYNKIKIIVLSSSHSHITILCKKNIKKITFSKSQQKSKYQQLRYLPNHHTTKAHNKKTARPITTSQLTIQPIRGRCFTWEVQMTMSTDLMWMRSRILTGISTMRRGSCGTLISTLDCLQGLN